SRKICCYVVLKAVLADVPQQLLHLRNLDDTGTAKCMQRIVGESALADITGDLTRKVVGRETREAHRPGLYRAVQRSMRIILADGPRDDLLEIHLNALIEEMLRQVGAVEAYSLVRV